MSVQNIETVINKQSSVYKCQLVAHDYLFFSSKGFRDTTVSNYIENYALMYAINRKIPQIQRNASGTKPFYKEDMSKIKIYATPATITTESRVPVTKNNSIVWSNQPSVYITFNSVNSITQSTENSRLNFPQIGRKAKFPPFNSFEFFTVGGDPSGLIRLGKKQVPCRIFAESLHIKEIASKVFQPSHPINIADMKELQPSMIKSGQLIKQNTALLVNAHIESEHFVCSDDTNKTYKVLKPDANKYSKVSFTQ
jgi:CRISPR type I-D-associated protein Csc1